MRPIRSSGLPTRIRLVERIGHGSFGEVWLARDTADGVDVAVKFLESGSDGIDGDRFEREARSLARLSGVDGIVAIRDLGLAPDGSPWLVTRYLPGNSLQFKLNVDRPEPWSPDAIELAKGLLAPLAGALASAHQMGVAHGDISPANVLFDASDRPHLADFGLAELQSSDSLSPADNGGLTPAYAAPERLRGARPGARSDVYSLAATLWHVISGETRSSRTGDEDREALDPIVKILKGAMVDAPGLRPSAQDFAVALQAPEVSRRRWRYRRTDGKR